MEAITRRGEGFNLDLRTDKPTWTPAPYLPPEHTRRLKALNHNLEWRWDGAFPHWQVWFNDRIDMPYIVHRVQNEMGQFAPIEADVFEHIRKSLWWSQIKWRERAAFLESKRTAQKAKDDEELYDGHYQRGLDLAPIARDMARGIKTKNIFPGADL